jgi:hypothetical protein
LPIGSKCGMKGQLTSPVMWHIQPFARFPNQEKVIYFIYYLYPFKPKSENL